VAIIEGYVLQIVGADDGLPLYGNGHTTGLVRLDRSEVEADAQQYNAQGNIRAEVLTVSIGTASLAADATEMARVAGEARAAALAVEDVVEGLA
jgi:hypothetical protein